MSEGEDYLGYKPGHFKLDYTRNKYGVSWKTGATLRRSSNPARQGYSHRNNSLIVKHVSVAEGWSPNQVEDYLDFDDGDLRQRQLYRETGKRGKSARSVVAQKPIGKNVNSSAPSCVAYSINKKNRWLLSDEVKDEIDRLSVYGDKYGVSDVNLTVIERELLQQRRRHRRPDVTAVASTALQEKETSLKPRSRKSKRKTYSYSTDMLKLSEKIDEDEKENGKEAVKSGITYEVCTPRTRGPFSVGPGRDNHEKHQKNKRTKREKHKEQPHGDISYYFSRKNNYVDQAY